MRIDARRDFVRRVLPWLIAAAMLLFYVLTLNHWVSLPNMRSVVAVSGWNWTPEFSSPLFSLATMPLRLLPETAVPMALNLFSAVCAALTLGLLARSVGLLPHDRTEAQQVRERNDFFLLTIRSAWLPPLLAALLCGLQLTFWEMATNGGPEMFDLLLFAFVIWSLVEYRLDGRVWRLYSSAAVVGAGAIEGPAMAAFFPLFVVAIIWVRGLAFFNVRFLIRMFLYGLAGLMFILLYQLASAYFPRSGLTFWQDARYSLESQITVLRIYWDCISSPGAVFSELLMPIFITLMPLLVMSIRWKFGDSSKIGSALASLMFHAIHAIFLGVCLWIAFDPPFSPREKNLGLSLYYLIALSAGYYAGYFLLIFGRKHPRAKDTPMWVNLGNTAVVICIWVAAGLTVAGLVCKNAPVVRGANGDILRKFSSLLVKNLPPKGAIVLSDDPERMYLAKEALVSDGTAANYLLVNTAWLPFPQYHRFLNKLSPDKWPLLVKPEQTNTLNALGLVELLALLNRTNELYYLHPSFGYYFEEFYAEPHGLVYKLKLLPNDTLVPPPPGTNLVAENETFWKTAQSGELASVPDAVAPPDPGAPVTFVEAQLARLHIPHESNIAATLAGAWCSRSLDFWGVDLQRMGDLTDAATEFRRALQLNPDNNAAKLNLQVNNDLAAGRRMHADPTFAPDKLNDFKSLLQALTDDGPIDDPAFCFQYGFALAQENKLYRQAVAPLKRASDLDPDFPPARIWLARVYGMNRMPDRMMNVLRSPLVPSDDFSPDDAKELNMLMSAAYFQENDLAKGSHLLEMEVSRDPTNQALLTTVGQIYLNRGMFSNAMAIANMQLRLSPDNTSWLLTKGYIYNRLKQYEKAIETLNRVLAVERENSTAMYQIANAYFGAGNMDAARTNFLKLQQRNGNSPQLALGLAEIAWRERDTNEAIRNIEIYLSHGTNSPQAQFMAGQLRQLKQPSSNK
ncbi:MAG TPA: tetratricopeptide repeat protein [Candidatus Sulfotelmatobacter sp.]|nr:tetratricopeptide repeat protein [Candidatus Sulfotelmatobacter sp.]